MRYTIHTKKGLRKFIVSTLKARKHVNVIDEDKDGSVVINCEIPISDKVNSFQIDIQNLGEDQ